MTRLRYLTEVLPSLWAVGLAITVIFLIPILVWWRNRR